LNLIYFVQSEPIKEVSKTGNVKGKHYTEYAKYNL